MSIVIQVSQKVSFFCGFSAKKKEAVVSHLLFIAGLEDK
jgi:hypothetical protein